VSAIGIRIRNIPSINIQCTAKILFPNDNGHSPKIMVNSKKQRARRSPIKKVVEKIEEKINNKIAIFRHPTKQSLNVFRVFVKELEV